MKVRIMNGSSGYLMCLFALFVTSFFVSVSSDPKIPIVVMHGIKANAATMNLLVDWIHDEWPDRYVLNVEVGDGSWDSVLWPLQKQVEVFNGVVSVDEKLKGGFYLLGYSQGGLVTRGWLERYNDPPVKRYLSFSSPHAGEFGLPNFNDTWLNGLVTDMLREGPYVPSIQNHLSFATYWKDIKEYDDYLKKCTFLPDINNERDVKNATYKKNIESLERCGLVKSYIDTIIIPAESSWFEFYKSGTSKDVIPLRDSEQYTENWLGLKTLDEKKKLFFYSIECLHPDEFKNVCKSQSWPIVKENFS